MIRSGAPPTGPGATPSGIPGDGQRSTPREPPSGRAWVARRPACAALALLAMLPAGCTTIGPSAPVSPGRGKSAEAFARDRTACMAETDARVQPMANRLNLVPRGPDGIAADNRVIQGAYDEEFGRCMADRGDVPAGSASTAATAVVPPATDVVGGPGTGPTDRGPAADAFRRWFVTRSGCFDRQAREARCSLSVNLEGFKLYYGDAGHGHDGDVLVLAMVLEDPTGNGDVPLVGYLRREGAAYRFVEELPDVHAAGIVPGTAVRFTPGRISFVGLTHREAEGRDSRTGATPITVRTD
jgi:hypothetical protein